MPTERIADCQLPIADLANSVAFAPDGHVWILANRNWQLEIGNDSVGLKTLDHLPLALEFEADAPCDAYYLRFVIYEVFGCLN
ncbi:MAG TPA: hypothetical protein VGQ39_16565 [Pyrinomonadaceae bacterium]|jgi:hypothetical protein|nr:hypothetical protein [Pyrinomonadaceae bacterium]